ncbi:LuxR family transcriptional regulator, maltose regulon positive regulatory protein [Nocardioides sp. YR527]|nr:LuxR family transcriptional regulator, maltose regulon positive regulatory protein [Nocardioides sp. YR527]
MGPHPGDGWFGVPTVPSGYVPRPRLLEMLDRSDDCPFVLVSAPAGTGKTALLVDWVAAGGEQDRTAWITFEETDVAFWPGLLGCLESLGVAVSPDTVRRDEGSLDRQVRRAVAEAVCDHPSRMTVVVDGHDLLSAEVAEDLDFLLRHTGDRLRLVLATRADPVLPMYRYRLDDTVVEVRMSDLAFTDEEAGELTQRVGLTLTPESVHALNLRTKGWAAGLRFGAQLLRMRQDPDDTVSEIVGDTGNIAEYLVGEMLAAQSPDVRALLLATSVPDTIQPGLAEALAGPTAERTLNLLTRDNVLIEPVSERPGCYRYNPLFRDLLRAVLAYESPDEMRRLQRAAAEWYARDGQVAASVGHFVAIEAWEEAAAEVVDDLAVGQLLLDDSTSALTQSLRSIPSELEDPASTVVRATLALGAGDTTGFTNELAQVRTEPGASSGSRPWATNVAVRVLEAVGARASADPSEAMSLATAAEQALEAPDRGPKGTSRPELIALVLLSKGIAALRQGRLAAADAMFKSGVAAAMGAGSEAVVAECLGYQAVIACCRGKLSRAARLGDRAIGAAECIGVNAADRTAAARIALGWVEMERYDLRAAADHVQAVERQDLALRDPIPHAFLALIRARLQVAHGDRLGAVGKLEDAVAGAKDERGWLGQQLRIELAHVRVAAGEPAAVEVDGLGDQPEAALVVGLMQLHLGDAKAADAAMSTVLSKRAAVPVQVSGWLVECARRLHDGPSARAHAALDRALTLASPERVRRPFHEAPSVVRQLLVRDKQLSAEHEWLFEISGAPSRRPSVQKGAAASTPARPPAPVFEELTEKEMEVLGHLANLLTTEEIAGVMYISVNTIRTHVRNILRKLGVSRRNAAVRRARELGLLPQ